MGSKKDNAVFTLRDLARLVDSATDHTERMDGEVGPTNYIKFSTANLGPKYWKYSTYSGEYCDGFLLPNLCTMRSWMRGSSYPRTRVSQAHRQND